MTDQNDDEMAVALLARADGNTRLAARLEPVAGGLSGASVFRIEEYGRSPRYVKIAHGMDAVALRGEAERTAWLFARDIRVPRILGMEKRSDRFAVLMEAMPGVPADVSPMPVQRLTDLLGKRLAALHALPATECPFDESLARRLARAARAIANGRVDPGAFEPRHRGIAPEALLARLIAEQPAEDLVVVHGDAMLNNIMITAQEELGFVDCGNAGRGDRYLDLALLAADIEAHHGAQAAARFVQAYGEYSWDRAKASFYLDLYELF